MLIYLNTANHKQETCQWMLSMQTFLEISSNVWCFKVCILNCYRQDKQLRSKPNILSFLINCQLQSQWNLKVFPRMPHVLISILLSPALTMFHPNLLKQQVCRMIISIQNQAVYSVKSYWKVNERHFTDPLTQMRCCSEMIRPNCTITCLMASRSISA